MTAGVFVFAWGKKSVAVSFCYTYLNFTKKTLFKFIFCNGKKNWLFHDSVKGAEASTMIYSISETPKFNELRPYFYFRHLLTELPGYCDDKGNIDPAELDDLLPWSEKLPDECRKKPRR